MDFSNAIGIPVGILRVLSFLENNQECGIEPLTWNLRKSRDGRYSLFIQSANSGGNQRRRPKENHRQPQINEHANTLNRKPSVNLEHKPDSQDKGLLSPQILESTENHVVPPSDLPKSDGKRKKLKTPSQRKRDRQRLIDWKQKRALKSHQSANARIGQCTATTPLDTSNVEPVALTEDLDTTELPPEQLTSSGLENTPSSQRLDSEATAQRIETPDKNSSLELTSAVLVQNPPESPVSDSSDPHLSFLDSEVAEFSDNELDEGSPFKLIVPEFCVNCNERNGTLRFCSACKAVRYCSIKCQKVNWAVHKTICARLKTIVELK